MKNKFYFLIFNFYLNYLVVKYYYDFKTKININLKIKHAKKNTLNN